MEIPNKFQSYFFRIFNEVNLGFSILEILFILSLFLLAVIVRGFFAKIIVSKIKKIVKKTGNIIDDHLFNSLAPPLKFLPIVFVFLIVGSFFDNKNPSILKLEEINKTLLTFLIFWLLHQSLVPLSQTFQKLEKILSKALIVWFTKSLRYLIIFLGIVAILETWGIKIGPIIAGLGLFGVAVALGAQDLFKNLISGIIIIIEKTFKISDVIEIPGLAIGTVEYIGFRSTLIRKFDSTPIIVPNYTFSENSIINFSDRKYRRINWIIGLNYSTTVNQLKNICLSIESLIQKNKDFIVNDDYKLTVRVEKFSDSSIDLLINVFTRTNEWEEYLRIKEDLLFKIKDIVNENNSSFAFPSHSIYVEKK